MVSQYWFFALQVSAGFCCACLWQVLCRGLSAGAVLSARCVLWCGLSAPWCAVCGVCVAAVADCALCGAVAVCLVRCGCVVCGCFVCGFS